MISPEFASGVSFGAVAMLAAILFLCLLWGTERGGVRGRTSGTGKIVPPQGGSGLRPCTSATADMDRERGGRRVHHCSQCPNVGLGRS